MPIKLNGYMTSQSHRLATLQERIAIQEAVLELEQSELMILSDPLVFASAMKGQGRIAIDTDAVAKIENGRFTAAARIGWEDDISQKMTRDIIIEGDITNDGTAEVTHIKMS